jgi:hypothetical protein
MTTFLPHLLPSLPFDITITTATITLLINYKLFNISKYDILSFK